MRREQAGFTIVELIITLVLMVILTGLSIVIIGNIQAQARDTERQQDVEAIARGLEQYYKIGNPKLSSTPGNIQRGTYPGTGVLFHMMGNSVCNFNDLKDALTPCDPGGTPYILQALPGVSAGNLESPSGQGIYVEQVDDSGEAQAARDADQYVISPLYNSAPNFTVPCPGGQTSAPCTKFLVSYKKETGSKENVYIESRRQQ